ncbi:hypothetical protein DL764_008819 [Monosporascus ibericus]|uniref:Heterokaryon incompatibility domain-containing protein n=1 Tax=Monosporascus ibericus TaxID=155417 RepID=A0A4Q4SWI6_9PEZI|nr:hypothetical protein DL764_008819 [Monosporascus ibericus]
MPGAFDTNQRLISVEYGESAAGGPRPPESFICDECHKTDFLSAIRRVEEDPWDLVLVAQRTGLHPDCVLCKLFAAMILPGTYDAVPADKPWKLRAFKNSMGTWKQDNYYFRGIPRVYLYAAENKKHSVKHLNNEKTEKTGLLAVARTRDVRGYAEVAEAQELPSVRFTPAVYDPELVKQWLDASDAIERELSEMSDGETNDGETSVGETSDGETSDGETSEGETSDPGTTEDGRSQSSATNIPSSKPVLEIKGMKVIDCETSEIVNRTTDMEHIALSYVWRLANDDMVSLGLPPSDRSEAEPTRNFLPPSIPRVVHNAMTVVKDLGFRYLWVDQFCIHQSASTEEIEEHLSKMDLIYSSARLTIIAASTQGALPGVGTSRRIPQKFLRLRSPTGANSNSPEEDELTFFTTNPPVDLAVSMSTWFSRGWCFQEEALSCRRLYFTDHEMLFEAYGMERSDSYPDPILPELAPILVAARERFSVGTNIWESLLRENEDGGLYGLEDPRGRFLTESRLFANLLGQYMRKEITFDTDAINAFRGTMKLFSRQDPNFEFLEGIPIFEFTGQRTGHHVMFESGERETVEMSKGVGNITEEDEEDLHRFRNAAFVAYLGWALSSVKARRVGFPSWSWTGWKISTYYLSSQLSNLHFDASKKQLLELEAVESTSGRVIDFGKAPTWFSRDAGNPMFLIGEAMEVPLHLDGLMLPREREERRRKSVVLGLQTSTSMLYQRFSWRMQRLGIKVPRIPLHSTLSDPVTRWLLKVFRFSRLSKCFAADTWEVSFELTDPELSGLSNELREREITRRIGDGRWSCLLLDEADMSAQFLIVSWEQEAKHRLKEYNGYKLRSCSRVGSGRISNGGEASRWFTDDYPDLPVVKFRLG